MTPSGSAPRSPRAGQARALDGPAAVTPITARSPADSARGESGSRRDEAASHGRERARRCPRRPCRPARRARGAAACPHRATPRRSRPRARLPPAGCASRRPRAAVRAQQLEAPGKRDAASACRDARRDQARGRAPPRSPRRRSRRWRPGSSVRRRKRLVGRVHAAHVDGDRTAGRRRARPHVEAHGERLGHRASRAPSRTARACVCACSARSRNTASTTRGAGAEHRCARRADDAGLLGGDLSTVSPSTPVWSSPTPVMTATAGLHHARGIPRPAHPDLEHREVDPASAEVPERGRGEQLELGEAVGGPATRA